jgi:hypothetical protein
MATEFKGKTDAKKYNMTSYAARLYGTYCCQIISIHVAGAV